jgi:hypothetical protein
MERLWLQLGDNRLSNCVQTTGDILDTCCEACWPNLRPLPRSFMVDDDAARGLQLLHHAKTELEVEIPPHGVTDNLGGESICGVAGANESRQLPT